MLCIEQGLHLQLSHPDGSKESNLEFSVLLKDTSTCVKEEPVIKPPTLRLDGPPPLHTVATINVQMLPVHVSIHYAQEFTGCE